MIGELTANEGRSYNEIADFVQGECTRVYTVAAPTPQPDLHSALGSFPLNVDFSMGKMFIKYDDFAVDKRQPMSTHNYSFD
jgi:hypothetical protein